MLIELSDVQIKTAKEWGHLRDFEAYRQGHANTRGINGKSGANAHVMSLSATMAAHEAIRKCGYPAWFSLEDQVNNYRKKPAIGPWWDVSCRTKDTYDLLIPKTMERYPRRKMVLVICKSEKVYDVVGYLPVFVAIANDNWLQTYGGRPPAWFVPRDELFPLVDDKEIGFPAISAALFRRRMNQMRDEVLNCERMLDVADLFQTEMDCLIKASLSAKPT